MTKEQELISSNNCEKAKQYFNLQKGYVLHHKDTTLRHTDIERYIQWNPEDLVVMKNGEHTSFHWTLDKEERRKKISESNKGKHNHRNSNNPNYGKKHPGVGGRPKGSPATKGNTGMHWFTNGIDNVQCYECPDGFALGRTLRKVKNENMG